MQEVKQALSLLSTTPSADRSLFVSAQQKTAAAISAMAKETGKEERRIYIRLVEDSMKNLGYSTTVSEGENAAAVQATRGHEVRVIGIDDKLYLERDGAGLSGKTCADADDRIEAELEKHGLKLGKARRSHDHGDARGGDLIRECGKQHRGNLAEGYVASRGEARSGPKSLHQYKHKRNSKMMERN
jgi:hypothetical protein